MRIELDIDNVISNFDKTSLKEMKKEDKNNKKIICDFKDDYGREPIIRKTKNGTLLCICLSGGNWEPENKNVVKIMKSYDDGDTWTKPKTLFQHHSRGVWSSEMFIDHKKIILFIQTYNAESYYRELQTFYSMSIDNGETWSEPISLPYGVNGISVRQGIVLSNGNYLFPMYYGEVTKGFDWNTGVEDWHENFIFRCGVIITKDKFNTINTYGCIKSKKCLWEPNCIEVEPGHIIMYIRNNNAPYLGISHSYDFGETWTEFEQTDIPNANTKVTLVKANDLILLISNFNDKIGLNNRIHLQIWISKDCKNWYKKIKLEEDNEVFFYPHAFFDSKKQMLYIAYENSKQFWLKKVKFEDLIND